VESRVDVGSTFTLDLPLDGPGGQAGPGERVPE
jgi:hypothetical protein